MEEYKKNIYLQEIVIQCEYARRSVIEMNRCLTDTHDASEFFRGADSFLQHWGLVSKLLWPPSRKTTAQERGRELRQSLKLKSDNSINDRTLRNHVEHYDERLDHWVQSSPHHQYVDRNIGPLSAIIGQTITQGDIMRQFDPNTNILVFKGERFDIQKMVNDLKEIEEKSQKRLTRRCSRRSGLSRSVQGTARAIPSRG